MQINQTVENPMQGDGEHDNAIRGPFEVRQNEYPENSSNDYGPRVKNALNPNLSKARGVWSFAVAVAVTLRESLTLEEAKGRNVGQTRSGGRGLIQPTRSTGILLAPLLNGSNGTV